MYITNKNSMRQEFATKIYNEDDNKQDNQLDYALDLLNKDSVIE